MTGLEHVERQYPRRTTAEVLAYHDLKADAPMARLMVLLADRYDLDPLLNHLEVIKTRSGPKLYITRDGYLDVAHRSGQLDGIVLEDSSRGGSGWRATVSVWRKDMRYPFTYSAGCGDSEAQAEQGNGEEMAIARAERRALKRAFRVITVIESAAGLHDDSNGVDMGVIVDGGDSDGFGFDIRPEPVGRDWVPSSADQRDAHKAIGTLDDEGKERFLADWRIDSFAAPWPADAVADALSRRA